MLDHIKSSKLLKLLEEATDKQHVTVDAEALRKIRAVLKTSDDYVSVAYDALIAQLNSNHAQTRLLAVIVIDDIFTRSKTFRHLLSQQFSTFLELAVGYKPDRPLPGPVAATEALREKTLELVEKWKDDYGKFHPQVVVGYKYLKDTCAMRFPELRVRAAQQAEERRAREQRTQQLLQNKYTAIAATDFEQLKASAQDDLVAVEELLAILDPNRRPQGTARGTGSTAAAEPSSSSSPATLTTATASGSTATATAAAAAAVFVDCSSGSGSNAAGTATEALEWEDIPAAAGAWQQPSSSQQIGGCNYYDQEEDEQQPEGLDAYVAPDNGRPTGTALEAASVLDNISDMCKRLSNGCLRRLQEWLRLLVAVDLTQEGPARNAERERLLRAIVELRNQVQVAMAAAHKYGAQVPAALPTTMEPSGVTVTLAVRSTHGGPQARTATGRPGQTSGQGSGAGDAAMSAGVAFPSQNMPQQAGSAPLEDAGTIELDAAAVQLLASGMPMELGAGPGSSRLVARGRRQEQQQQQQQLAAGHAGEARPSKVARSTREADTMHNAAALAASDEAIAQRLQDEEHGLAVAAVARAAAGSSGSCSGGRGKKAALKPKDIVRKKLLGR